MKSIVIGGSSRNVGKTSLAVSIIASTKDLDWTAVKVTQFGHGVCSRSGGPCGCAVTSPQCPYDITVEEDARGTTDTARMVAAGASEVLWLRVALGRLEEAIPTLRRRLRGKSHVLFESNSLVEHWRPDAYLSVLQRDIDDLKPSAERLAATADAFVLPPSRRFSPPWTGFDAGLLDAKPVFRVSPPSYCTREVVDFVRESVT